tara:strand:+ start:153 stop:428 length:276 start_codon:yes stop_codon:yes gene_type:complete
MKLEEFNQAIKGQHTVRLEFPHLSRKVEVSDLTVGESGLLIYTYWDSDVCREVLTRVSEVVEVKSVCTIEEWNAGCDAFDALHDLVGLRGM